MNTFDKNSLFYNEAIDLINLKDYGGAINCIKKNFHGLKKNEDDLALAYLNCGFLNYKLGNYCSAIDCFSKSINYESRLELLDGRSKDISYSGRSNSRFKKGDYLGAIDDKRKAKKIRLLEIEKFSRLNNSQIDYKKIILGQFDKLDLPPKFNILIKVSRIKKNKYDLIEDYKKVINKEKKKEIISKLEKLSESKYIKGDFKGSIKAIRRSEKYY